MKRITPISAITSIGIICLVIIFASGDDCDGCFSAPVIAIKFLICGLVIAVGSIYYTKKFIKTENIIFEIESQPVLNTDEAVDGVPFAGEGIIESEGEKLLKSPYTNTSCVYFHSIKEKYVKRGKSSSWEIVENMALFVPFYLQDERGKIKIDLTNLDDDFSKYKILLHDKNVPNPKYSEVDCETVLSHTYTESGTGFFGSLSSTRYREKEFVLRPKTKVFVYGLASRRNKELWVHEDPEHPLIISKKSHDQYIEEFYRGKDLIYLVHFLIAAGFTIALFSANHFLKLSPNIFLGILFLGNFFIIGSVIFSIYNRIITLRQRALNALSNIDIELKRRLDLIPNLVEAVKGYSKYEKEIQQIIAESRARVVFSKEITEEKKAVIPSLVATIENYPNLRASDNFQSLIRMLVDTEERIAYSREFYNRTVRKYNTLITQFPFLLIAILFGRKAMEFISIARGEKTTPSASF